MADSSIAITAGSGTVIDTRTESTNSNHRQVVVIGDPATNAGVAPVDATNGLSVSITNASLTVATHAITLAAGTTAIAKAEDSASADADVGVPAMAIQKATPADTAGTDGDYAMLQMSAGRLWSTANVDKVAGNVIDTNSGSKSAGTVRVVLATDQPALTNAQPVSNTPLSNFGAGAYETVAASQTDQAMGATGASGDYLAGLLVVPASTSPGAVSIKDGSGSAITVFTGGATSVSNLVPFFIPLGIISGSGAWKITTGASVSCIGVGKFT